MTRELLQQALDALINGRRVRDCEGGTRYQPDLEDAAITALREALAAPQPEPVAEVHRGHLRPNDETGGHWCKEVLLYSGNSPHDWLDGKNIRVKLYAAPPAAPAVPLTDEQIEACIHHVDEDGIGLFAFARAIEKAHGIGGGK